MAAIGCTQPDASQTRAREAREEVAADEHDDRHHGGKDCHRLRGQAEQLEIEQMLNIGWQNRAPNMPAKIKVHIVLTRRQSIVAAHFAL
jgi:hypothetical protein